MKVREGRKKGRWGVSGNRPLSFFLCGILSKPFPKLRDVVSRWRGPWSNKETPRTGRLVQTWRPRERTKRSGNEGIP